MTLEYVFVRVSFWKFCTTRPVWAIWGWCANVQYMFGHKNIVKSDCFVHVMCHRIIRWMMYNFFLFLNIWLTLNKNSEHFELSCAKFISNSSKLYFRGNCLFFTKSNEQTWWCNQNGLVGLALIHPLKWLVMHAFLSFDRWSFHTHAFVE